MTKDSQFVDLKDPSRQMRQMDEIQDLLKAARIALRMSREELSEASNVHLRALARMEQGYEKVRLQTVTRVRAALEKRGIVFIAATEGNGPGFLLPKKASEDNGAAGSQ